VVVVVVVLLDESTDKPVPPVADTLDMVTVPVRPARYVAQLII